ncbi:MAG: hypothetical protein ACYDC4_08940 [Candidatus Dormibacteria bacterium]
MSRTACVERADIVPAGDRPVTICAGVAVAACTAAPRLASRSGPTFSGHIDAHARMHQDTVQE